MLLVGKVIKSGTQTLAVQLQLYDFTISSVETISFSRASDFHTIESLQLEELQSECFERCNHRLALKSV